MSSQMPEVYKRIRESQGLPARERMAAEVALALGYQQGLTTVG